MTDFQNTGQNALTQNALTQSLAQTQGLRTAMAEQAGTWMQLQSGMLDNVNALTMDWLRRRREATAATQEAISRLAAAKDTNALVAAYSDWVSGSLTRLAGDINSFADLSVALSEALLRTLDAAPRQAATTAEQAARAMAAE